jgi:hypothetical protein
MFSRRKIKNSAKSVKEQNAENRRKRKVYVDEGGNEVNISWWTPWRSVKAFLLAAAIGTAGAGLYHYFSSRAAVDPAVVSHMEEVNDEFSLYDSYSPLITPLESIVSPGSRGNIIKDSVVMYGIQSDRKNMAVRSMKRFTNCSDEPGHEVNISDKRPFIRPVDTGQELYIQSAVRISGMDFDDLEGIVSRKAGIRIIPGVPEILPYYFSIDTVSINSKGIPMKYVEARNPDGRVGRLHYYVDLRGLVRDNVLDESDFKDPIDISIDSSIEVMEIRRLYEGDVAGMFAYKAMPEYLRRFTEKTSELPIGNPCIKKIVDAYDGQKLNVLDIVDYALRVTGQAFSYKVQDEGQDLMDLVRKGEADCEYYSKLFVTVLRAFGVPARPAEGPIMKDDGSGFRGRHEWVEVLLPFKDGSYRWVLAEPTWADDSPVPDDFINYVDGRYLYSFDFDVQLDTGGDSGTFYVLQDHRWHSTRVEDLDAEISDDGEAQDMVEAGARMDMPPLEMIVRKRAGGE